MKPAAVLLAVLVLWTGRPSSAQSPYDLSQLPAATGRVAQYSLTPRGDVDGLLLDDGTEVHLPPHLGSQLVAAVRPGDAVTIRGLRARSIPMMQALSVTNDATGRTVADTGGPLPQPGAARPPGPTGEMQAQGTVKSQLHGPRGDFNGVLLTDGTVIRLPPPEAQRLSGRLQPGMTIAVQGPGSQGPLGRAVEAARIGPDLAHLGPVSPRGLPGPPPRPMPPAESLRR